MKKILLMYATYGTGHKAIANYIDEYFSKSGEYETKKIDLLDYKSHVVGSFTDKFFNWIIKYFPFMWNGIYKVTDNKVVGTASAKLQSLSVNDKAIRKIVLDYKPDMVIATHFTAATYISKLKKSGELDTSLISIVTDYKAHQVWLDSYKSEDALIVNSPEEKRSLIKKGINPKIIKTFGMPISSAYSVKLYNRDKLMKKLKFTGKRPIILFYGGGGCGMTLSLPYLETLIEKGIDADIVFVCGRSEELKEKAEALVKKYNAKNVRVEGFITNGPEYMTVCDFVITKPGGITVTECLCFKKPMVLIRGTGGQEKDNYKYLVKKGYAINTSWKYTFGRTVKRLCDNPTTLSEMRRNLNSINKEESMIKLFGLVGDILDKKAK